MDFELEVVGEACRVILIVIEFEVQCCISNSGCNQFNSVKWVKLSCASCKWRYTSERSSELNIN